MDEARLVVELVDRAGASGQAAAGVTAPGAANVPGSTLAQDHHDKVTQQGAGASLGAGSAGSDPLLPAVQALVAADPGVKASELQTALGIPSSRADNLLAAAIPSQPSTPPAVSPPPTPPPASPAPSVAPSMPTTGVDPEVARFYEEGALDPDVRQFYQDPGLVTLPDQDAPEYSFESLGADEMRVVSQGSRRAALDFESSSLAARGASTNTAAITQQVNAPSAKGVQQAVNLVAGLAAQGGPVGGAVGNLAQAGAAIPGVAGALAPIAPAIPYIGAAIAAVGIPTAVLAAAINEADRARMLVGSFSPEAVAAEATANVRELEASIRSANRLGDEVADYVDARSRIGAAGQGIRDILSEPVIQRLNELLDKVALNLESTLILMESPLFQGALKALGDLGTLTKNSPTDWINIPTYLVVIGRKLGLISEEMDRVGHKDNPLRFYLDRPMPAWPPPFNEGAGDNVPLDVKFVPVPGLSL